MCRGDAPEKKNERLSNMLAIYVHIDLSDWYIYLHAPPPSLLYLYRIHTKSVWLFWSVKKQL